MFMHVRLQLLYSHAWTCTLFRSRWTARPWILSVRVQAVILWIIMIITWLIHWMAATMPESIYRPSLDGCTHTLDLDYYVLCYGWLCPYHIHHVFEISVVLLHTGFPTVVFSVGHVLVKYFHPSISLGPHALGGICYTAICHRLYYPSPASWRTHSETYEKWHDLQILALHSSEHDLHLLSRHLHLKNPKNSPFSIGMVPQCSPRTNGGNPSKRVRQLALCHRVTLAPTINSDVFSKKTTEASS